MFANGHIPGVNVSVCVYVRACVCVHVVCMCSELFSLPRCYCNQPENWHVESK